MSSRHRFVHAVTVIVVLVFAVGIWASGGELRASWLRFYSLAVLAATLALSAWDQWFWHTRLGQMVSATPRDVRGTWKGILNSFWTDPAIGERPTQMTVYLVVHQTASRITVRLLTQESASTSTLALVSAGEESSSLAYMYLNHPDLRVEHHSRPHNGAALLSVSGRPASRLRGRYWTDRDSLGELNFAERTSRLADDYEAAESLFGGSSSVSPR